MVNEHLAEGECHGQRDDDHAEPKLEFPTNGFGRGGRGGGGVAGVCLRRAGLRPLPTLT